MNIPYRVKLDDVDEQSIPLLPPYIFGRCLEKGL